MSIGELDVLIGVWQLSGRTREAGQDDISGEMTAVPILGGGVLQLTGTMQVGDTWIDSLEVTWKHPDRPGYGAHVYPAEGDPLDYRWDIDGDTLTHAGLGMTYTGTISADRATIAGDWVADADRPDMAAMAYHAVMRRVA